MELTAQLNTMETEKISVTEQLNVVETEKRQLAKQLTEMETEKMSLSYQLHYSASSDMEKHAAVMIQQQIRSRIAKLHFHHTKDEHQREVDAAIMLQAAWRGARAYKEYTGLRTKYELIIAASKGFVEVVARLLLAINGGMGIDINQVN